MLWGPPTPRLFVTLIALACEKLPAPPPAALVLPTASPGAAALHGGRSFTSTASSRQSSSASLSVAPASGAGASGVFSGASGTGARAPPPRWQGVLGAASDDGSLDASSFVGTSAAGDALNRSAATTASETAISEGRASDDGAVNTSASSTAAASASGGGDNAGGDSSAPLGTRPSALLGAAPTGTGASGPLPSHRTISSASSMTEQSSFAEDGGLGDSATGGDFVLFHRATSSVGRASQSVRWGGLGGANGSTGGSAVALAALAVREQERRKRWERRRIVRPAEGFRHIKVGLRPHALGHCFSRALSAVTASDVLACSCLLCFVVAGGLRCLPYRRTRQAPWLHHCRASHGSTSRTAFPPRTASVRAHPSSPTVASTRTNITLTRNGSSALVPTAYPAVHNAATPDAHKLLDGPSPFPRRCVLSIHVIKSNPCQFLASLSAQLLAALSLAAALIAADSATQPPTDHSFATPHGRAAAPTRAATINPPGSTSTATVPSADAPTSSAMLPLAQVPVASSSPLPLPAAPPPPPPPPPPLPPSVSPDTFAAPPALASAPALHTHPAARTRALSSLGLRMARGSPTSTSVAAPTPHGSIAPATTYVRPSGSLIRMVSAGPLTGSLSGSVLAASISESRSRSAAGGSPVAGVRRSSSRHHRRHALATSASFGDTPNSDSEAAFVTLSATGAAAHSGSAEGNGGDDDGSAVQLPRALPVVRGAAAMPTLPLRARLEWRVLLLGPAGLVECLEAAVAARDASQRRRVAGPSSSPPGSAASAAAASQHHHQPPVLGGLAQLFQQVPVYSPAALRRSAAPASSASHSPPASPAEGVRPPGTGASAASLPAPLAPSPPLPPPPPLEPVFSPCRTVAGMLEERLAGGASVPQMPPAPAGAPASEGPAAWLGPRGWAAVWAASVLLGGSPLGRLFAAVVGAPARWAVVAAHEGVRTVRAV